MIMKGDYFVKNENISRRINRMIVMNIKLDNFFAFKQFNMNMSYPKKIVDSYIKNETLLNHPNFRYKKVNILMGANATGKTSIGKMLMNIFNFMDKKQYNRLTDAICDRKKEASFSIDFVGEKDILYHVQGIIVPPKEEKYLSTDIDVTVKTVSINQNDSYESCVKRLEKDKQKKKDNYIEELEKVDGLSWLFQYPNDYSDSWTLRTPQNNKRYTKILEYTLKALDSSIEKVDKLKEVENAYVIRTNGNTVIIQDGKITNGDMLSSGTKAGIEVAGMMASIIEGECSFYYCDEKFSYIHSDLEKAVLSVMIHALRSDDQIFFTTHNTDILELPLPKHSFVFLRKDMDDSQRTIECISASDLLKRNTDVLKRAVENDLFSVAPATELIYEIANL